MWPHELVYGPSGQPTLYEELMLPLFISGYLTILESVNPVQKEALLNHLSELMANSAIYRWEPVWTLHAIWVQQLENNHADWGNEAKKLEFRHTIVCNPVYQGTRHKAQPIAQPQQRPEKDVTGRMAMANPGTKACAAFNIGKCTMQADHPKELHIYTYCLAVAHKQCTHQECFCQCKSYNEATIN